MGRPIKKKYFGNTNSPYQNQASGGVTGTGGESVASVTLNALGAYTVRPTFTFTAPTLPGGVTATGTITSEVESVTAVSGTQTNYTVGQLVTVDGTDAVLRVATIGGTGGDDAVSFDFTGGSRGTFTTLTTGARATTSDGAGAGLLVTLRYRAKAVVIVEAGSKYTAAPTATPTQSVTFTSVALTTTKANAITVTAKTTSAGTVLPADIFKQEASRRYLVKTTDGVAQCKLVASDTPAFKQMAVVATDTNGSTYWVMKLTAHKALLTRRTMTGSYLFATNTQAGWTLGAAAAGVVSVANA
jgi:hypothetical protein